MTASSDPSNATVASLGVIHALAGAGDGVSVPDTVGAAVGAAGGVVALGSGAAGAPSAR